MRSGTIIAAIVAVIVIVLGIVWYNNQADDVVLEDQPVDDATLLEEEEDLASEADVEPIEDVVVGEDPIGEEDTAAAPAGDDTIGADDGIVDDAEVMAREDDALATEDDTAVAAGDGDAAATEEPIVVGDEITEDTIVVDSATEDAVVIEPEDDAASSLEVIGDTAIGADQLPPEDLLTPANFDSDAVRTLLAESDDLTAQERSTLRALVAGAEANPDTVEATLVRIRAALDLPPLE